MTPFKISAWCAAIFLAANLFPHTVALRLTALALGLALAVFGLWRANVAEGPGRIRALPPLLVPILLWAAWAALSVSWSVEPEHSMKEFKNEVVYVFLGYWLCWIAAQASGGRRALQICLIVGAVLTSVLGIYGYVRYGYIVQAGDHWIVRIMSGPGDQSSALLTLMPLAVPAIWLAHAEKAPRGLRLTLWALPPLFLAAAYVTLNRTVWIGFAVELVVIGLMLLPRPEFASLLSSGRVKLLGSVLAVAFVGGLAAAFLYVQETRFDESLSAGIKNDPRWEVWNAAVETIKEHPATGLGFGRGINRQVWQAEFSDRLLAHAHNVVLEAAVDTGLPGAALFVLLIGSIGFHGWKLARRVDSARAAYGIALMAILAGMLVRNMTDVLLVRQNALLFWGVTGLLLGLSAAQGKSR